MSTEDNFTMLFITEYKKTIKDELLNLPDKDLSHILVSLIDVDRPSTNKRADKEAAKERAKMLYNNGDILSLLCEPHSRNQLKETFDAFLHLYRVNINQFIEDNSSALSTFANETLKGCGEFTHEEFNSSFRFLLLNH